MLMCTVQVVSRPVASLVIIMMELLQHDTYLFGRLYWSAQPLDKFVKVLIQVRMSDTQSVPRPLKLVLL